MDKRAKYFISDNQVTNRSFFEPLEKELTCPICEGLLSDPILCQECETPFCARCIDEWKDESNQCIMKCPGIFRGIKVQRSFKKMMDLVLLKCSICQEEVTLLNYPSHYEECEENNRVEECPFCDNCQIRRIQFKNKDIDISSFPKLKAKMGQLEKENFSLNTLVSNLNHKVNYLEETLTFKNENIKELSTDLERLAIQKKSPIISSFSSTKFSSIQEKNQIQLMNVNDEFYINGYKLIAKPCAHYPNLNYITIYSCCEKAYNCFRCHDEKEDHKLRYEGKGYCRICTKFFEKRPFKCSVCASSIC